LRDVCDEVLSDAKCSKSDLANRIHALSLIGTIYQAVTSDETEPTTTTTAAANATEQETQ
jgi:hypothetical protein